MTNFTVDIITAPITDGRWSDLRAVLDTVPGSALIEDPEEPRLMIPIDADSPMKAATFVEGISQVIGFTILRGNIYETPEIDYALEDDPEQATGPNTAATTVTDWFSQIPDPKPRGRRSHAMA